MTILVGTRTVNSYSVTKVYKQCFNFDGCPICFHWSQFLCRVYEVSKFQQGWSHHRCVTPRLMLTTLWQNIAAAALVTPTYIQHFPPHPTKLLSYQPYPIDMLSFFTKFNRSFPSSAFLQFHPKPLPVPSLPIILCPHTPLFFTHTYFLPFSLPSLLLHTHRGAPPRTM